MALERVGWLRGFSLFVFFGVVEGCFCRGFCEKLRAERGFLMVNLWWIDGKSWWVEGRFLTSENFPLF
jgi:hypothetical protein